VAGLSAIETASRLLLVGVDAAVRHPQAGRRVREAIRRGARVRSVASRHVRDTVAAVTTCLPGHEVEEAARLADHDLVLWSSELALHGQAGAALARFGAMHSEYLRDYVNQLGLFEAGLYPPDDGASAFAMLQRAAAGELKALLIFADDPFEFFPALAARAFAATDLVVVVDAVETRSTAEADIVFPGALLAEKHGTVHSGGNRGAQSLAPVQRPPSGLTEGTVANRLMHLFGSDADRAPLAFTRGRDGPAADAPSSSYPFIATLDVGTLWENHALVKATITARREMLAGVTDYPDGYVALAPADARTLKLRAWAPVRVTSDAGAVTLTARLDERVLEGTVALPMRCWESAGSALGALELDPCLRIPIFRPRAVRLGPG
jgi:predicted molibdopterin-dependent oxidoreductase YjgC